MQPFKEKNLNLTDPYVTAGNRVYIIGCQDGSFPDNGGHIDGEMGGVWSHPIKWLDGFFVGLRTASTTLWPSAQAFRTYPFFTEHHYSVAELGVNMVRSQFVPDDEELAFVTLALTNTTTAPVQMDVVFAVKSDLRPGWLGTEEDGKDEVTCEDGQLAFRDGSNGWSVMIASDNAGSGAVPHAAGCPVETKGNGVFGAFITPVTIDAGQTVTVRFGMAGSLQNESVAKERLRVGMAGFDELFAAKQARVDELAHIADITVPDADLTDTIRWVKYNNDWLVRNVPSIGNGLGAGLPEYPWWFGCDNGYALQGVLASGAFELAKDTLRLLARVSERENGNGRIIHELSTTDVVYNPGNTQETPQFCMTVWQTYEWTGDREFLAEMYPAVKKAIDWTLSQAVDGELFPVGYGIMEVENLNAKLIDSAVYTEQALRAYAKMAACFGDDAQAKEAVKRADELQKRILECYWLEAEGVFADVRVDAQGMNEHLRRWAERQENHGLTDAAGRYRNLIDESAEGEQSYLLGNWVISTPMEVGIASNEQAERQLTRMRTPEFRGPSGLYLSGIDRTHMMTISTSVQAVAESRYGYVDEAVEWLRLIAGTRDIRTPGSISEMSPDYGCFVQAWTIYGVMVPLVQWMFGVHPDAAARRCTIAVQMPSAWNNATLTNLRVGDNLIDVEYDRREDGEYVTLRTAREWTFEISNAVTVEGHANHRAAGDALVDSAGVANGEDGGTSGGAARSNASIQSITLPAQSEIRVKLATSH